MRMGKLPWSLGKVFLANTDAADTPKKCAVDFFLTYILLLYINA